MQSWEMVQLTFFKRSGIPSSGWVNPALEVRQGRPETIRDLVFYVQIHHWNSSELREPSQTLVRGLDQTS